MCVCVFVCVCDRQTERQRDKERHKERQSRVVRHRLRYPYLTVANIISTPASHDKGSSAVATAS